MSHLLTALPPEHQASIMEHGLTVTDMEAIVADFQTRHRLASQTDVALKCKFYARLLLRELHNRKIPALILEVGGSLSNKHRLDHAVVWLGDYALDPTWQQMPGGRPVTAAKDFLTGYARAVIIGPINTGCPVCVVGRPSTYGREVDDNAICYDCLDTKTYYADLAAKLYPKSPWVALYGHMDLAHIRPPVETLPEDHPGSSLFVQLVAAHAWTVGRGAPDPDVKRTIKRVLRDV